MLEFMDYLLLTGIFTIELGLFALAYYLDQRAFKVETIAKFEKLMLAWEGRLSRVAGKFEGAEVPEMSMGNLLMQSIFQSEPVQNMIANALRGIGVSGPGIPPPKKKDLEE